MHGSALCCKVPCGHSCTQPGLWDVTPSHSAGESLSFSDVRTLAAGLVEQPRPTSSAAPVEHSQQQSMQSASEPSTATQQQQQQLGPAVADVGGSSHGVGGGAHEGTDIGTAAEMGTTKATYAAVVSSPPPPPQPTWQDIQSAQVRLLSFLLPPRAAWHACSCRQACMYVR